MRKQLTKETRAYWQSFGADRFTKQDSWRLFMGRYYDSGGKASWPKDDFMRWLALERKPLVASVPGPRGGESWCLSKDLVDAIAWIKRRELQGALGGPMGLEWDSPDCP